MIDLSICIVSYNTKDLLKQCIGSIYREMKSTSFEIFVVDNASIDGTVDMVKDSFPNVLIIGNEKNLGFATANNQAIKKSRGRYILLLNPDTVILDAALDKLVGFMELHPEVGAVGPQLIYPDGTFQFSYDDGISLKGFFRMLITNNFLSILSFFSPIKNLRNRRIQHSLKIKEVGRVRGCCLLVRQSCLTKVGLMDEHFFMYCEEVDWEFRIKNAGWKICFFPFARVIHYWGASTKQNKEQFNFIQFQSNYKYFRKHYGNVGVFVFRCMLFVNFVIKTLYLFKKIILYKINWVEFQRQLLLSWKILWLTPDKNFNKKG